MFDVEKIIAAEKAIRTEILKKIKQKDDCRHLEYELEYLSPYITFVETRKSGFLPHNPEYYGSKILSVNIPGIRLRHDLLLDTKVLYAGIVQGWNQSQMNLFMIVEDDKYFYSINTNNFRNEHNMFFAVENGQVDLLFSTITPKRVYGTYTFQSFDLCYRGSIIECLQRFRMVQAGLPDKMSDGWVNWTKANVVYLQNLINNPELDYKFDFH
jgi:hypothetical protein